MNKTFANNEVGLRAILLDLMIKYRHVIQTDEGLYRFVCEYNRDHSDGLHRCPNNENGICLIQHSEIPWHLVHNYNGRKMYQCPCG